MWQWLCSVGWQEGLGQPLGKAPAGHLSVRVAFAPQHVLHRDMLAEGLKHRTPSSGNRPLLRAAGGASEEQKEAGVSYDVWVADEI